MLRLATCVLFVAACTDLTSATSGVCGNGAIDPGEDCDGNAADGQACGAAGEANACHFACSGGATCPTGFACGVDLRCRAPSGTFALGPGPFPFVASSFRGGDVDGDGIADLIGVEGTRAEVRFGAASGDFSNVAEQIIPASTGALAFADLDGDGRIDLLLATPLGMVTLLGSAGGFNPHPYSSISLDDTLHGDIRVHQVHPLAGLHADLLLLYDELDLPGGVLHEQLAYPGSNFATCFDGRVVSDDSCGTATTIASLLGGTIAVGRTGYVWSCPSPLGTTCDGFSAADPTDEVAVAVQGQLKVTLLSATQQQLLTVPDPTTAALAHVQDIVLPATHDVATDGRMMFADFDGDHCDDLAVPVVLGSVIGVAVAYNTGCTGKLGPAVVIKSTSFVPLLGHGTIGTPRLYADLDGDGIADIVTDQQIFLATCTAPCATWTGTAKATVPRPWTRAIAADVNQDGRLDIVGIVDGEADVDVLINGGGGTFARFEILTDLPVLSINSGDFDGDLYQDIAIVTGDTTSSAEDDQLAISFGAPAGGPSDPIAMGSFGVIRSLEPALIETTPNDPEGISDLLLVADRAAHRNAAVMIGSTSRQVIAPFEIDQTGNQNPIESPLVLMTGDFDGSGGTDVAEIAADADVYALPGTGGGDVSLGASFAPGVGNLLLSIIKAKEATSFTHGPLTAGGVESIIGFGTSTAAAPTGTCQDTSAVIATPSGATWEASELGVVAGAAGPPCLRTHGATTHDLDGDGAADVLLELCDSASCRSAGTTVAIYGGGGTLDVAHAAPIPTGDLICGRFTPVTVSTSGADQLLAVCLEPVAMSGTNVSTAPVFVVTFAQPPGSRELAEVSRFPIAQSDADLRITVGDFNGDHLQDLAVTSGAANATVVTFYLQCAAGDPACAAIPQVKP